MAALIHTIGQLVNRRQLTHIKRMKTVSVLLKEASSLKNLLRVKGHTSQGGEEHIHITGTPEGFRLLAAILEAQAAGLGGVGAGSSCFCELRRSRGHLPFLTDDSSELFEIHCHDNYFDETCEDHANTKYQEGQQAAS